jgi:hypothetical protein
MLCGMHGSPNHPLLAGFPLAVLVVAALLVAFAVLQAQ